MKDHHNLKTSTKYIKNKRKIQNISKLKKHHNFFNFRLLDLLRFFILISITWVIFTGRFSYFTNLKISFNNYFFDLTKKLGFKLEEIEVVGYKNSNLKHNLSFLLLYEEKPILALKKKKIINKIEEDPWIKNIIIKTKLPNKILLIIIEKEPIAIWQYGGILYLIEQNGDVIIKYENSSKDEDLMHVVGVDANLFANYLIEELNKDLDLKYKVRSATMYGRRRWDLNLEEGIKVKMPEKDFSNAYSYLIKLHSENKLFGKKYKVLDLRNKDKYLVEYYK